MRLEQSTVMAMGMTLATIILPPPPVLRGGDAVLPGQSVEELLSGKEPAPFAAAPRGGGAASPFLFWTGAIGFAGAGLFVLRRRRRTGTASASGLEPVEVLGRAVLSHKHAVVVVRAAGKRIVVGLGGDSMSALAVIDDARDQAPRAPAHGYSSRLEAPALPACPAPRAIDPAELVPYRRQMERLRNILRAPGDSSRLPREEG